MNFFFNNESDDDNDFFFKNNKREAILYNDNLVFSLISNHSKQQTDRRETSEMKYSLHFLHYIHIRESSLK